MNFKRLLFTVSIIITLSISCTSSKNLSENLESMVDEYINPLVESRNFSGTIFIAHDGKILYNKGFGMANFDASIPNTPDTKFQIASLSKTFTVAAILLLQQRGLLKVSDPISHFLPDYPHGDKITVHQLLNHTSGLPRYVFFPDYKEKSVQSHTARDIVEWIKDKPLAFNPGERSGYSNSNYAMLAYIIELVSGMEYNEFLKTNIFDVLNLSNTGHSDGANSHIKNLAIGYVPIELKDLKKSDFYDYSIAIGAGSLCSTTEDLFHWYQALVNGRLLNEASLDLMMNQRDDNTSYGWIHDTWFGKDVFKKSGWDGVGFASQFVHFQEDDLTIIILMNLSISGITAEIANNLSAIVLGKEHNSFELISNPTNDEDKIEQIIGIYRFGHDFYVPNSSIEIIESGGYFYIKNQPDQKVGLIQISEEEYIDRQHWLKVKFVWNDNGQIVGLKYGLFEAVKESNM